MYVLVCVVHMVPLMLILMLEYEQARLFYLRTLSRQERLNLHMIMSIAQPLMSVSRENIKFRFLAACYKVSPDLVQGMLAVIYGSSQRSFLDA